MNDLDRFKVRAHGHKQKDIAEKSGVSARYVSKVLTGKANVTYKTLNALNGALDDLETAKGESHD